MSLVIATERRNRPRIRPAWTEIENSNNTQARWPGLLYMPYIGLFQVHDVSRSSISSPPKVYV